MLGHFKVTTSLITNMNLRRKLKLNYLLQQVGKPWSRERFGTSSFCLFELPLHDPARSARPLPPVRGGPGYVTVSIGFIAASVDYGPSL